MHSWCVTWASPETLDILRLPLVHNISSESSTTSITKWIQYWYIGLTGKLQAISRTKIKLKQYNYVIYCDWWNWYYICDFLHFLCKNSRKFRQWYWTKNMRKQGTVFHGRFGCMHIHCGLASISGNASKLWYVPSTRNVGENDSQALLKKTVEKTLTLKAPVM